MLGRDYNPNQLTTNQEAGFKSVQWDTTDSMGRPVSAGVYLYQIYSGEFVQTKKMVLLKQHFFVKSGDGNKYTEKEINKIIDQLHSFEDIALLRRELICRKYLSRLDDGSEYLRIKQPFYPLL